MGTIRGAELIAGACPDISDPTAASIAHNVRTVCAGEQPTRTPSPCANMGARPAIHRRAEEGPMLVHRPSKADDQLVESVDTQGASGAATGEPPEIPRRPLNERIDVRVALGLGVAWLVLPEIGATLEPTAHHADPSWAVALGYGMNVLFLAMLFGLAVRRRWGLVTSLVGATVMTAFAVACPTSGHHAWGLWWVGQMACVLALVVGSVWALRLPPLDEPAVDASAGT